MNPKVPPHDDGAEQSVLGAILLDKDAMVDVVEFLRPNYFYKDAHAVIFGAMMALYEAHEPIDVVSVTAQLKGEGNLKKVGGTLYVSDLLNVVPTSAHAQRYGRIIAENYIKRQLINVGASITELAFKEEGKASEIVDSAEQQIFAISQQAIKRDFIPIKDALASSFDRLDELHKRAGGLRGVPTCFPDLDFRLAGMQDANLLILAARPGTGKTAMILNISQFTAVHEKIPVGIFSLEMSKEELVDRLLVSQADIDAWKLKTGKLTDDDFARLSEAMGELA